MKKPLGKKAEIKHEKPERNQNEKHCNRKNDRKRQKKTEINNSF